MKALEFNLLEKKIYFDHAGSRENTRRRVFFSNEVLLDSTENLTKGDLGYFKLIHSMSSVEVDLLKKILHQRFGHRDFRPYQEQVCLAAASGQDLLLVMPTGAGKSLCFQLPGVAREGTTLVISPLIALMDDQVSQLKSKGFRVAAIHSGRDRLESREVCRQYLAGELEFLFISPEKLSVPGFIELLVKKKISLIAVDEAHCISHWGHDFRPDYRSLGERLQRLRPTPILAITATATERVQDDIVAQLKLQNEVRFIHGFRRTNLGIELIELSPNDRVDAVKKIVRRSENRPLIIYTPSRKLAEYYAEELKSFVSVDAYHAGLPPEKRDQVQRDFLEGRLEVVTATIAFGMGVDKSDIRTVIHTASPGSMENYYQEIGRAGRDGRPSRAILMFSYVDRSAHEFFHSKNYPELKSLQKVFKYLVKHSERQLTQETLLKALKLTEPELFAILQQLRIHGGIQLNGFGVIQVTSSDWERTYILQRRYRLNQLDQISEFLNTNQCRMVSLLEYFGDKNDSLHPCRSCDVCDPSQNRYTHVYSDHDKHVVHSILNFLSFSDQLALGRLYQTVNGVNPLSRSQFQHLIGVMKRSDWISMTERSFEKDDEQVEYFAVSLTRKGKGQLLKGHQSLSLTP